MALVKMITFVSELVEFPLLQCERWSCTLTRHSLTASTLWTTSWWCTTRQITPTVVGRKKTSSILRSLLTLFPDKTFSPLQSQHRHRRWTDIPPHFSLNLIQCISIQVLSHVSTLVLPSLFAGTLHSARTYQNVFVEERVGSKHM